MTCPRLMSPIDLPPCRWPTVAGEPVATEERQERTTPDRRPSALTAAPRPVGWSSCGPPCFVAITGLSNVWKELSMTDSVVEGRGAGDRSLTAWPVDSM